MHRLRNRVNANFYNDDDDAQQVLSLEVEEGRWFDRRDEAMAKSVVVISRDLRERLFPRGVAIGKRIDGDGEHLVIGVLAPFRPDGNLAPLKPAVFLRNGIQDTSLQFAGTLLMRVRPGAGVALERQLTTEVLAIGKSWNGGHHLPT